MKLEVVNTNPRAKEAHMGSYVGIDLHRRRPVVVVLNEDGDRVSWSRIDNTPANLAAEIVAAGGAAAEVAMEATWGWYWAADVIAECGARLHLAHPLGIAGYENRRVKNDVRDATLLADLLRMGRLPEAWVAPPEIRELRELVRYRHKLSRLRAGLKGQVHQTLGKEGAIPELAGIWKSGGQRWLSGLDLGEAYASRIGSLRELIAAHGREVVALDARIHSRLKGHPGYEAIQAIAGVGPVFAAVFVAEIGDIDRFDNPRRLCSWAGLTPRHRESDSHVRRGGITKQGSRLIRWAASRRSRRATANPASPRSSIKSGSVAVVASAASPPPVTCSPWCSTGCATGTSAVSPPTRRHEGRARPARRHDERHDQPSGAVDSHE
jgi:transposase